MAKPVNTQRSAAGVASLEKERAELDALFFSIGEGAIVTDSHGNISRINDIALQLLGYQKAEVAGKWYPEMVVAEDEHGELLPNIERPNTEVFLTGKAVYRRLIYRKKNGAKISVATTVSPILLLGSPIGAIEVFRDITKEVALERTKDEFISVASHELRTPATIVKQYIGMVLEGYFGPLSPDQKDMLQNAYQSNERQLDIINNMLQVAHAEADKVQIQYEKVHVTKLLQKIVAEQNEKYRDRHHSVQFVSDVPDYTLRTDPVHVTMMAENILSNAHKYTPEHKHIEISLHGSAKGLKLVVQDEGIGISKKDFPKLFQKFSRIDNPLTIAAGGSGLGLFWVKKLVELHGGTISVDSKPGKGTKFEIFLPDTKP